MRAQQIITESITDLFRGRDIDDQEKGTMVADYIREHCQPWLKVSRDGAMEVYRGVSGVSAGVFMKPIRNNRKPLHSSALVQEFYDRVIGFAGGIANRTNSAFVSKDFETTTMYGEPFVFLPLGEFHYTWATDVDDWFESAHRILGNVSSDRPELSFITRKIDYDEPIQIIQRLLNFEKQYPEISIFDKDRVKQLINVDTGIELTDDEEIMVHAKAGLYIDPDFHTEYVMPVLGK